MLIGSNVTLIQCMFNNNKVLAGGVMFVIDSRVTIDKSTFINNAGRESYRGTFALVK